MNDREQTNNMVYVRLYGNYKEITYLL